MPILTALLRCAAGPLLALAAASAVAQPLPPPRPGANAPAASGPAPAGAPAAGLDQAAIVERANAYLNSLSGLTGDFAQTGADGRQYRGKLYVQKPGKLRFEYNPPAVLEVVSDGSSVVVRDRKLATQDLYAIGQTPLKFLLKDKLDLARDTTVLRAAAQGDTASVTLEDRNTVGGVSRITLTFDAKDFTLRSWRIRDPQGSDTFVTLSNIDTSERPDPAKFRIEYQRDLVR
jgi:outer membrane lipoprotein-sorting protein